jgi:hypothetical protein
MDIPCVSSRGPGPTSHPCPNTTTESVGTVAVGVPPAVEGGILPPGPALDANRHHSAERDGKPWYSNFGGGGSGCQSGLHANPPGERTARFKSKGSVIS